MQLKCRKCNGAHLTIKCGIEPVNKKINVFENKIIENIITENKSPYNGNNYNKKQRKTFKVKISELPSDLSEEEMMELLYDWGDIVYLKVINYDTNSVAFVDFKFEVHANYFVKALHKTLFEYLIISVLNI